MKKNIYILPVLVMALLAVSCNDFLKSEDSSFQSKQYQFSNYSRTKSVATQVYAYLTNYLNDTQGTMREAATDNAVYSWESNAIKTFYDGSWSPSHTVDDRWSHFYGGIRAANYYLENAPEDFPGSEYTDNYEARMRELKLYKYEVRALRAYFHFELARRYNRIVIVDRSYKPEEINNLVPRDFSDVIDWVVSELDAVIPELPVSYASYVSNEYGRITRGTACAMKIRALLYKASPLNNPDNIKQYWTDAAVAARDFISNPDFTYRVAREEVVNNASSLELIFGIYQNEGTAFEATNYPVGINGAYGGICPTQNLAEAFDYIDNNRHYDWKAVPDSTAAVFDFSIRDPRMKRTLRGNGQNYNEAVPELQTFRTGKNGLPKDGATPSSYYLYKFIQPETVIIGTVKAFPHVSPVFRYSEVLLNYAEALFEATGDPDFSGVIGKEGFAKTPVEAVNEVRKRFGMTTFSKKITPDEFRQRLRDERRVEFAFEDQRFWDIRRWKIGEVTEKIYGLDIVVKKDKLTDKVIAINNNRILLQNRVWNDKYYWYPIPDSELFKNHNLKQNPGW